MDDDHLEPGRKKITKKAVVRLAVALTIALAGTMAWVYVRYVAPKAGVGGPCRWAMNCTKEAPRCMRESEDGPGVCSRACDADGGDCAPDVHCVAIELDDERDDRGVPIKSGYCFPQSFIDGKRAKKRALTAPVQSWIEVPEGRLEGELTVRWEREGSPPVDPKTYQIKGALVRHAATGKTRIIVDTASMRLYAVDDEKKTFLPSALEAATGEVRLDKTGRKDAVDGRPCEIWRLEEARVRREACILQGAAFVDPTVRATPAWVRELAVRGALALRVIELDASGRETGRMTAHFEPRPIDANVFVVPKAYKSLAAR